jgi:hypothetical protein
VDVLNVFQIIYTWETFFGSEPADPLSKAEMDFFAYMEDAMEIHPGVESFVDDFVAFILKMMSYDEGRRVVHLWTEMGFEMCGHQFFSVRCRVHSRAAWHATV